MDPPDPSRVASPREPRTPQWSLATAIALETSIVVWGIAQPDGLLIGLLVMGPLVAAAFCGVRATAAVATAAAIAAALLGARAGLLNELTHVVRVLGVGVASAFAVFVAVERQRRDAELRRLQRVADIAQSAILRPVPPIVRGLQCSARYQSSTAEASVGGDFYEVLDTPFGVRAVVGDVRGKGIDATRLAAVLLGCFREAALTESALAGVAKLLDDRAHLYGGEEDFATAVIIEFGARLTIVNCGHPAPLKVSAEGVIALTSEPTLPLGLGTDPTDTSFGFEPGAMVLMYTDGIIEARDHSGSFFDLPRAVSGFPGHRLADVLDRLLDDVAQHVGHRIEDDLALLAVAKPSSHSGTRFGDDTGSDKEGP